MISIKPKADAEKCIPNLLPCRVNYDGPVNATERLWKPATDKEGKQTVFFRGRRLLGRDVQLPPGYEGAVIRVSKTAMPSSAQDRSSDMHDDEDGDDDERVETFAAERLASFERFTVWNHEAVPEGAEDAHVKGVEEWIAFAEVMHTTPPEEDGDSKKQ